ncbi:MAG: putative glycolipid-binding domain-containing protein [Chloroflexia bacterium]|nr:putative glycolipid-binding domain-containing protein [Chloroflexia bacterium]
MAESPRVVLWQSLTGPGTDWCELSQIGDSWRLAGTVQTVAGAVPAAIDYEVDVDVEWRTRRVMVEATIGSAASIELGFRVNERGQWYPERYPDAAASWVHPAELTGLADIDLAFTPATNILPIRRLQPAIGETVAVTAAWLRFPELIVEPLPQTYHRLDDRRYHYESGGGEFTAELLVDDWGLVVHYEGLFERVAASG